MRGDLRRWGVPALGIGLAAIALAFQFRPFFARFGTHVIGDHGDALLLHLHCAWQWSGLAEGRFAEVLRLPTLAPYANGFAFGELLLGVTLPLFPVYWITGSSPAAFNAAVVLSFAALALAVFLWVRVLVGSASAGALAAIALVFVPWRLHYLSAVNVLTLHYLVFALYFVTRWLQEPKQGFAFAAALCFVVQVLTATQAAIAGAYLGGVWMAVVWAASGFAVEPRRCTQGALALALALGLTLPWLGFYADVFSADAGLLRTTDMFRYSEPFAEMARGFGAFGLLGVAAVVGLMALAIPRVRPPLPAGTLVTLLGLGLGTLFLFVVGRGPYLGDADQPTALPGYYAAMLLPGLDSLRAPIRLTAFTPVYLALLAGVGTAALVPRLSCRIPQAVLALAPLLAVGLWPSLDPGMASPLAERAEERRLAERLAQLPPEASVLSLPLQLNHRGGSAVDERVLLHRRRQVGGFASVVPGGFWRATRNLGQWPFDGHAVIRALGATHLVVPAEWIDPHSAQVEREGYRTLERVHRWVIVEVPVAAEAEPSFRVRVPGFGASNGWVTLALEPGASRFFARGHDRVAATWRGGQGERAHHAHVFYPGVASPGEPILIHVPTPREPGEYQLEVAVEEHPIRVALKLRDVPTTRDARPDDVRARAIDASPIRARVGQPFGVDVELEAGDGPVLLASSTVSLPDRQGETELVYRFVGARGPIGGATSTARTALPGDLAPGDRARARWYLMAPPIPGTFDVEIRLVPANTPHPPPPWQPFLQGVDIVANRKSHARDSGSGSAPTSGSGPWQRAEARDVPPEAPTRFPNLDPKPARADALEPHLPGRQVEHDLLGAAPDRLHAHLPVQPLDQFASEITCSAKHLRRFPGAELEGLGGVHLGLAELRHRVVALGQAPRQQLAPRLGRVHLAGHLGDLVADHLVIGRSCA